MRFCTSCGASLAPGRFCTNCGAAVAEDPTTAAQTAQTPTSVRLPVVQPDAATGPRYPLYAEAPPAFGTPAVPATPGPPRKRRRAAILAVASVATVALIGTGTWLLLDDGPGGDDVAAAASDQGPDADPTSPSTPPATATDTTPSDGPEIPSPPDQPAVDLSGSALATGPRPMKPGRDLAGRPVRYPVGNMLDGDDTTAYRLAGDATGTEIVLTLDAESTIYSVGLVNGYAKTDGEVDWYQRNRKVMRVSWTFDDGTVLEQSLKRTTDLQTLSVPEVSTRTIRLRLLEVSAPGRNPRNATAISTVSIQGAS